MSQKFAAFDVDGTIVRTGLFFQIVDELIANGHLPAKIRADLDSKLEKYRRRTHSSAFDEYVRAAVDTFFANFTHVKVSDYRRAVDVVVDRSAAYTYVYTRELIKSLKNQGYFLIALSGSETYAIKKFTKNFDFDIAIGDTYVEKAGTFTGEVVSVIFDKGVALQKVVAEHDLDYRDSIAVGDSHSDAKMMEIVEQPIAFNPESRLLELAISKQWKVIVERKNVIYKLEPKDGSYVLAQAE